VTLAVPTASPGHETASFDPPENPKAELHGEAKFVRRAATLRNLFQVGFGQRKILAQDIGLNLFGEPFESFLADAGIFGRKG